MSRNAVLVRREGSTAVYELDGLADFSNELLDSLDWSVGASKAAFRFKEPITSNELSALSELPGKYIARIGYTALKSTLASPSSPPAVPEAVWRTPTDFETLKALTRKTVIEHFYEPWRELESPHFLKELESFLENGISLRTSAHYLINGRAVGLINLLTHQDCYAQTVAHIAWIWIDNNLAPAERADAHSQLVRWLAGTATSPIHAFVHSFNGRSRSFFEKIGFTPSCIHISRRH